MPLLRLSSRYSAKAPKILAITAPSVVAVLPNLHFTFNTCDFPIGWRMISSPDFDLWRITWRIRITNNWITMFG